MVDPDQSDLNSTTSPSEFGNCTAARVCYPHVGAIEGHPKRCPSHGKCPQLDAITGAKLRDAVVSLVRYPDVDAIKGNSNGAASHRECPQVGAVAAHLRDVVAAKVRYPHVGAIEGQAMRTGSYGKRCAATAPT